MSETKATYTEQLHPCCVVRSLPGNKPQIVARFRRRGDAEMHLQVVQRLSPGVAFGIVFDGGSSHSKLVEGGIVEHRPKPNEF